MDLFEPVTGLTVCLTGTFSPLGVKLAGGIRRLAAAGDSQPLISIFCRAWAGYSSRSVRFWMKLGGIIPENEEKKTNLPQRTPNTLRIPSFRFATLVSVVSFVVDAFTSPLEFYKNARPLLDAHSVHGIILSVGLALAHREC